MLEAQMCNGPFIFGDSTIKRSLLYRIVQFCILCFRLVTPVSFLLVLILIANELSIFSPPVGGDLIRRLVPAEWLASAHAMFTVNFLLLSPLQRPLVTVLSTYVVAELGTSRRWRIGRFLLDSVPKRRPCD